MIFSDHRLPQLTVFAFMNRNGLLIAETSISSEVLLGTLWGGGEGFYSSFALSAPETP